MTVSDNLSSVTPATLLEVMVDTLTPAYHSAIPVFQSCSSAARRGYKVSRAESCWVSMWWKPKHITLNPPLSGLHPDQEPHSSAFAGSHLQTSLKRKRANYWLDTNRNKYCVACSCVGVVQHWRTRSSWHEGHLESHITHTGKERKERIAEGVTYEYVWCRHTHSFACCTTAQRHQFEYHKQHEDVLLSSACLWWTFVTFFFDFLYFKDKLKIKIGNRGIDNENTFNNSLTMVHMLRSSAH